MRWVVLVFVVARVVAFFLFDPFPVTGGDSDYYLAVASAIRVDHVHAIHGALTAYRGPAYPFFIAWLIPLGAWPLFIVQGLLTLAGALLAVRRIPGRVGLWTGIAVAACPFFIAFEWRVLAEALLIPLLWMAWLLLAFPRRTLDAWLAGVLLAVAILARETLVLLPLLAVLDTALLDRTKLRAMITAALAAHLLVIPWQLRNHADCGTYGLSEGRAGYNLWVGTWERDWTWARDGYPADAFVSPAQRAALIDRNPNRDDSLFKAAAIDRIRHDPGFVATSWLVRYPGLWLGTRIDLIGMRVTGLAWTAVKAGAYALNLAILTLGLFGVWRRRDLAFLAIPVAYTALLYIPFHNVETRFSLPALPFLILFAAAGLATPWRPARAPEARPGSR